MSETFTILIADRNPHVRKFLEREFVSEGYHVELVRDGKELLSAAEKNASLDLVILDPEIPGVNRTELMSRLKQRLPQLPVVIHGFLEELSDQAVMDLASVFVEKTENTDKLRIAVANVLSSRYPARFNRSRQTGNAFPPPPDRALETERGAERAAGANRILVVDDEQNIRDGCERVLERRGFKVSKVGDARDALVCLGKTSYALVLLDLKLPDMDGLELLTRIRKTTSDTPVIVITGYATVETAAEVIRLGANDFLSKPFTPAQLKTVVEAAIHQNLSGKATEHRLEPR
jgi:DNA-binding NtrC family response regulator